MALDPSMHIDDPPSNGNDFTTFSMNCINNEGCAKFPNHGTLLEVFIRLYV